MYSCDFSHSLISRRCQKLIYSYKNSESHTKCNKQLFDDIILFLCTHCSGIVYCNDRALSFGLPCSLTVQLSLAYPYFSLFYCLSSQRRCPQCMSHTMIHRRGDVLVSSGHPGVPEARRRTGTAVSEQSLSQGALDPIRRLISTSGIAVYLCVSETLCVCAQ